jgi:hypothetical protein
MDVDLDAAANSRHDLCFWGSSGVLQILSVIGPCCPEITLADRGAHIYHRNEYHIRKDNKKP